MAEMCFVVRAGRSSSDEDEKASDDVKMASPVADEESSDEELTGDAEVWNPIDNEMHPRAAELGALLIAEVKARRLKKAEKLIRQGADIESEKSSKSVLCHAVESACIEFVELLLKAGAKVRRSVDTEARNTCPFHRAAMLGHLNMIQLMVNHGVEVNIMELDFGTALHAAASRSRPDIVEYLVEQGAGINLVQNDGTTALYLGACAGNTEICAYLLKHGAEVNRADREGWTALHNASCFNKLDVIDILMEHGAKINQLNHSNESAVFGATQADKCMAVRKLFSYGADLNLPNNRDYTPLIESVSRHYTLTCWTLLDCGAEVNNALNIKAISDNVMNMETHEKIDLRSSLIIMLEVGLKIQAPWLFSMGKTYMVRRVLSLNRLYRHLTDVRTLQSLCINVIRGAVKKPISENVQKTGLPTKLHDRICLNSFVSHCKPSTRWGWGGGKFKEHL